MTVFQSVLILFLILFLGFLARKAGFLLPDTRLVLSRLLLYVTLPLFILNNLNRPFDPSTSQMTFRMLLLGFAVYGVSLVLSFVIGSRLPLEPRKRAPYQFAMMYSNTGFMGLPVIYAILGQEGVFFATIFNLFFDPTIWTYGVGIFHKGEKFDPKKLVSPVLIATVLGLVMYFSNLHWPKTISEVFAMVGNITPPLSMLLLGVMLTELPFREFLKGKAAILMSLYRLLIFPLAAFGVLYAFGVRGMELIIPVVIFGMPVAANGAIIASTYDGDYLEMTRLIILSTLLSLLTVPLISILVTSVL